MQAIKITKALTKKYPEIKKTYQQSFPLLERYPYQLLVKRNKLENIEFMAYLKKQEFIGLSCSITKDKNTLIYFLAIKKNQQSKGHGSKILEIIKEKNKENNIIINIEHIDKKYKDYNTRKRRLPFYQKNGFKSINLALYEYRQPFHTLATKKPITNKEYYDIIKLFLGKIRYYCYYRIIAKVENDDKALI